MLIVCLCRLFLLFLRSWLLLHPFLCIKYILQFFIQEVNDLS